MTTTYQMALLSLAFCVLPAASRGADTPSEDLLKNLKKIEFRSFKDAFDLEKGEFDAKESTFTWTLKSKTPKPETQPEASRWQSTISQAQSDLAFDNLFSSGPRLRFWNGDEKIGDALQPDLLDTGLGRDDHYRVKLKVKMSKEAVKAATDATYK